MQDCSNSTANALELLQSCTKPSKWLVDSLYKGPVIWKVFPWHDIIMLSWFWLSPWETLVIDSRVHFYPSSIGTPRTKKDQWWHHVKNQPSQVTYYNMGLRFLSDVWLQLLIYVYIYIYTICPMISALRFYFAWFCGGYIISESVISMDAFIHTLFSNSFVAGTGPI